MRKFVSVFFHAPRTTHYALLVLLLFCVSPHPAPAAEKGVPLNEIGDLDAAEETSVYDEIPDGHWAYRAVERLAERGLLDGRQGLGQGQPLTTYELAVIVGDMVDTYNSIVETGLPPSSRRPAPPEYAAPTEETPDETEASQATLAPPPVPSTITLAQALDTPYLQTVPRPPRVQKKKTPVSKDEPPARPGEAWLEFSDEARDTLPAAPPAPPPPALRSSRGPALIEEEKKEKPKEEEPKEDKKSDKKDEKAKLPKELKGLEKKNLDLTDKDIAILQELVDFVNREMKSVAGDIKSLKAAVKKDVSEVKKLAAKNEQDIERLEQDIQRFKVSGTGTVTIKSSGDTNCKNPGADDCNPTVTVNSGSTSFDVYSRPKKFQDMVLRTNLSGSKADMRYQNFERKGHNFMVRSLNFGPTSFSYSFLTAFGKDINGHTGEALLNDYTLKYHYGNVKDSDGNVIADTYSYGASLQSTMLGEPKSFVYISRILNYEDASSKDGCTLGKWNGSLCKPPFKNSVSSVFLRYPLTKSIYLSSEFAHSAFFRNGFDMMYNKECTATDASGNCTAYGTDFSIDQKYKKWRSIPEMNDQDDAYYLFLDYTKDNLSIFPLGYARLGSKFVSKYFGLPGMDLSDMGMSEIPIALQSLQGYILKGALDKKRQNFKWDFTFAKFMEYEPMYFDFSSLDSPLSVGNTAMDSINHRDNDALINVDLMQNKLTFYMGSRMNFSMDYLFVKGGLGLDCLDGELLEIKNDKGETIEHVLGNGTADCAQVSSEGDMPLDLKFAKKDLTYNFWMRTSKKGEYELEYKTAETIFGITLGRAEVEDKLKDIAKPGKEFSFNNKFKYRLTDTSNLEFHYNYKYVRPYRDKEPIEKDKTYKNNQSLGLELKMSF